MDVSIVEFYAEQEGYHCGYCKSDDTNYSHGMWAHTMTVQDYQDLIDRGWRRSGMYCYKPTLDRTCCPMYTIRCAALELQLSRSQRKVLRRMNAFLCRGETRAGLCRAARRASGMEVSYDTDVAERAATAQAEQRSGATEVMSVDESIQRTVGPAVSNSAGAASQSAGDASTAASTGGSSGGRPAARPPRRKAKLLRLQRKRLRLVARGLSEEEADRRILARKRPGNHEGKSLEQILGEAGVPSPVHSLQVRLVRSQPPGRELQQSLEDAHRLYCKYQLAVHGDPPDKCTLQQFTRFLVRSPLQPWEPSDGPASGYGSFHQQYWLDGRLIAVGVVDILPRCVSSVYFYYDPELSHLSLGTYASLRELEFTRALHRATPTLQYYYMGFYIHSCVKMRYKANYRPSFLLCPETYRWIPVERCLPLLDVSKYSRLCEDAGVCDQDGCVVLGQCAVMTARPARRVGSRADGSAWLQVVVLWKHTAMRFSVFAAKSSPGPDCLQEVEQYARLVGMTCARRMLLIRP
ncbi:arginyl-tRNA--protein transferase 1 isoform X2 [Bacillus rossius redtenbacheri]|uniref:arginyl-tRNA--protein transferase 1 isoform X2 n=1 Tax=Bacillus rossius redtenbacheri TaxID=93214 RepID=UPI002FDEE98F